MEKEEGRQNNHTTNGQREAASGGPVEKEDGGRKEEEVCPGCKETSNDCRPPRQGEKPDKRGYCPGCRDLIFGEVQELAEGKKESKQKEEIEERDSRIR